ncbi:MAG: hypothetical protein HRT45_16540 [Bdellovibrionales bacterium]|nr:hypothetical protein [Bdellovibrionales bacterium]
MNSDKSSSKISKIERYRENILSISWDMSAVCNYSCSYCDPCYHDGRDKMPSWEATENFFKQIREQARGKRVWIEMKGGEPTLWNELEQFLDFCKQQDNWDINLVSNGSRRAKWWQDNYQKLSAITLSFHAEKAEVEHFRSVLDEIGRSYKASVLVLMLPNRFEKCENAIESLRSEFPYVQKSPILIMDPFNDNQIYNYSAEQKNKLADLRKWRAQIDKLPDNFQHVPTPDLCKVFYDNDHNEPRTGGEILKSQGLNRFRDWECQAGIERLHISTDGTVFRGQCKNNGSIGSIYDDKFDLPTEPTICSFETCHCNPEICISKAPQEKPKATEITI